MLRYVALSMLVALVQTQDFDYAPEPRPAPSRIQPGYSGPNSAPKPTPVPIIKQIDRHNEDGSYTYGYESADGSFKIETKLPTGEVKGKYGYVDDLGKVRVIEYGATKHGFAPAGEGITVPPPTLVDETTDKSGALLPEYTGEYDQPDDQQAPLRAQPVRPRPASSYEFSAASAPRPAPRPIPRPEPLEYSAPQTFEPISRPVPRPQAPASTFSFDFPSSPLSSRPSSPVSSSVPPRPTFANASPQGFNDVPSRPAPRLTFTDAPVRSVPSPVFAPARPAPQYRPAPQPARSGGGSILDQLSKDYALPQSSSAPLHDISFGYF